MRYTKLLSILSAAILAFAVQSTFADEHAHEEAMQEIKDQKHQVREEMKKLRHMERERRMLESVDANKDGVIDEAEYMAHAKARFDLMDSNGDKVVTEEERKRAGKEMRRKHHEAMRKAREAYRQAKEEARSEDTE